MDHPAHSVAILAGGLATRFGGRDKGALLVDGRTILDRQIAEFSALTDDLMIVGAAGAAREGTAMARRQSSDDTGKVVPRRIVDLVEACGPLGGLHAALTEACGGAVFLVAGDMPYVTARFATYLLSLADEADIVVPQTERGYHPLCAVYTRACLATVAARLADRRLRMRELIGDMPTRVVTTEEIERFGDRHMLLANVNTPAEYAGLEALQGHKP
jgi:molybdopterin-guanine dinucleotide biosynthesis protein A